MKKLNDFDFRLNLIQRLGGKCVECGETNTQVLQIDHKLGQGYIEKQYFKNREEMFKQYLREYDRESKYIQVLCFNCNIKKRNKNKERKDRPGLFDLPVLQKPFDEATPEEVRDLLVNYPQFRPSIGRQIQVFKKLMKQVEEENKS